jgi:predicted nucleotidyltransferase
MTGEQAIQEITDKLIEFYRPVRIYLFGLVARADFNEDSDLDFLVVVPDNIPKKSCGPARSCQRFRQSDSGRTSSPGAGQISINGRSG